MNRHGAFWPLYGHRAPCLFLAVIAVLALMAMPAWAAPQTSVADLEDEVMCPICGTLLELTSAPQAERQRAFIARQIGDGASKEEIKDALVAEYGPEVLATPSDSGFDLSAYLVPIVGFAVAALALALGVSRWRRAGGDGGQPPARPPASDEDAERLDADLARYDL